MELITLGVVAGRVEGVVGGLMVAEGRLVSWRGVVAIWGVVGRRGWAVVDWCVVLMREGRRWAVVSCWGRRGLVVGV